MVDPSAVEQTAHFLSSGSISSVFFLLLAIIAGLIWERVRLIKKIERMTTEVFESKNNEMVSLKATIDMYYKGNLKLTEVLTEIKAVLNNIHPNRR